MTDEHDEQRDAPKRLWNFGARTQSAQAGAPDSDSERAASRDAAEAQARILERLTRQRGAQAAPTWSGMGPEPPLRTHDDAMRGRLNVDYFPNDACIVCGAVPFFNGRRVVQEHHADRHDAVVQRDPRTSSSIKAIDIRKPTRSVRTFGERDDDE